MNSIDQALYNIQQMLYILLNGQNQLLTLVGQMAQNNVDAATIKAITDHVQQVTTTLASAVAAGQMQKQP